MQQRIIDQLILTAGAWRDSGCKDEHLNRQFSRLLNELSRVAGTTPEGALDLLLAETWRSGGGGVMERIEREQEKIRNHWFKDHVATVTKYDGVTILDWRKPGTSMYAVKYVMVGNKLFISGDIGDAVYDLTWNATVESFTETNLGYFTRKLSCNSRDRWNFNDEKAIKQINEWLEETLHDIDSDDEDDEEVGKAREIHFDLIHAVGEWDNVEGYEREVWDIYQSYSHTDSEEFESISEFGRELPNEFIAYLLGIQMANEQLRKEVTA